MKKKAREEDFKVEGMTHRIFWTFVCVSILAIIYFNITELDDLKRLTAKFPEVSKTVKNTFLHTYKVAASLALVFADIILVGPFAYLSYFSDHIKPKPGKVINALSFFDLGLLSALIFTFWTISANFMVINAVSKNPTFMSRMIDNEILVIFLAALTVLWIFAVILKVYSYTSVQRRELCKYAIRF